MKRITLVLAAAIAAIGVAHAFFEPKAFVNPVGRPSTCVLQIVWEAGEPEVVATQLVAGSFPTERVCGPGKALAMATALTQHLRGPMGAADTATPR